MEKWIATHEKFGIREIASLFIINRNHVQFICVCVAIILVKVNLKNLKITLSYLSFAFKRISSKMGYFLSTLKNSESLESKCDFKRI